MPIVNGSFVVPGVFSSVNQNVLPTAPGGIRIPALIGTGRTTNLVQNESVTRGATAYDSLAHIATSLASTIQDENFVLYTNGVDYQLGTGGNIGKVEWLTNVAQLTGTTHDAYAGLSGLNLQLAIASGAVATVPFTSETTTAQVVVTLNNYFTAHSIAALSSAVGTVVAIPSGTITYGSPSNGDTVILTGLPSVGTQTFTKAATAGPAAFTVIAELTALINALTDVNATDNGTVITITVVTPGTVMNSATVTGTGSYSALSISFSGGANSLKVATTATSNSSLYIGAGTANLILGFTAGSYVQTPSQPAYSPVPVDYFVTYEYAKVTADYTPKFYYTLQSVVNDYGPVDSTTMISNGASLAFQNGASIVCVCQENPADGSPISMVQTALNKLLSTANIWIVIVLEGTHNAQLLSAIKQHVDTASSTINKLERRAIVGLEGTYTDSDMLGFASSVNDSRVVLINAALTTNKMFIGAATTESTVGGQYVAAALAGVRCNPADDVATPMTRETVSGFTSITNTLTNAEKSLLINQGVCVIDTIQGFPKVLFGTTTAFATVASQLEQVTEIADFTVQSLRGLLDPIFIGQKILANTSSQIETVTSAILQTIQQSNIIVSFTQPVATVDSTDATRINLSVGIVPVVECDIIYITLGLNLA